MSLGQVQTWETFSLVNDFISHFCHCRFSAASEKKIAWAVRIFEEWQKARNLRVKIDGTCTQIGGELHEMNDDLLCETMCQFILEVRKQSGLPYPRETLYSIVIMLQMYLETKGRHVRFLDPQSLVFVKVRNTLDNRMMSLSREGFITPKSKAQVITYSQEDNMWKSGILSSETPERLVYTLLYSLGVQFALQAGEEHKSLKIGKQLSLEKDVNTGEDFLQYVEHTAKNNQGGLSAMKSGGKVLRAYCHTDSDRCVIQLYKKYVAARPDGNPKCSKDFYLRPLGKFNSEGIGFSCQPLGIHKIESAIKNLCLEAGITGKRSNHSLRATSATHLYEAEMDEQLIQECTGHRSNAVRGYKRTSTGLQKKVCQTLYGPSKRAEDKPQPPCTDTQQEPDLESEPCPTPLHCSPEGQRMDRHLASADMSLREVMASAVSALDPELVSSVVEFFRAQARRQQSQTTPTMPSMFIFISICELLLSPLCLQFRLCTVPVVALSH